MNNIDIVIILWFINQVKVTMQGVFSADLVTFNEYGDRKTV